MNLNHRSTWTTSSEEVRWFLESEDTPFLTPQLESRFPTQGKKFRKMYLAAVAALINAVAMGTVVSYSAPATPDMMKPNSQVKITEDDVMWIGSLVALGGLVGGLAAGYFSNLLGRKGLLIFSSVPFTVGWLLIVYAHNVYTIFAGRVLTGVSCGFVSVTVPMYVVEISTPEVRGFLGALFQVLFALGVLLVMSMGAIMSWAWLAMFCATIPILSLFLLCFMPESPRWLLTYGKRSKAIDAILFLQGANIETVKIFSAMERDINEKSKINWTIRDLWQDNVRKATILSIGLMLAQQCSGVNAIMSYTIDLFKTAETSIDPFLSTIIVAAFQQAFTFTSSVLVDRTGRRILLIISCLGAAASLTVMGVYFLMKDSNSSFQNSYGWLPVVSLVFYVASISIGLGPVVWLVVAEISPPGMGGLITGVATAVNWAANFAITKTFNDFTNSLYEYGTFWLYASVCICSCIFVAVLLPETKGQHLDEIQASLRSSKQIIYSRSEKVDVA